MKLYFVKKTLVILLLLPGLYSAAADVPERIPLKTKSIKSTEWYQAQAALWKEAVRSEQRTDAWINFYLASRYGQVSREEVASIVDAVERISPNTFEALLLQGWDLGYSSEAHDHLKKAFALNPQHPATYASLTLLSEFALDVIQRKQFADRFWKSNQVSSSLLSYSYNVLMSVEENGILFTEGDNTTLPIFILQDVFNVRGDVKVLNLDMILESDYRDRKLKQIGIDLQRFTAVEEESDNKKKLCGLLPDQNPSQKFYYSLTIAQQNIADIKDQLYVVGLASQISKQRIDNINYLKDNLENRFLLDYLTVDFDGEETYATGKIFSANYLVPMLLLSEYYIKVGDTEKLRRWETLITKIAETNNKTSLVENFLGRTKPSVPFVSANLNIKAIEENFALVKDKIYAMEGEVTNADYQTFLAHLADIKRADLYEKVKVDLSQYAEPAYSFMKSYHVDVKSSKKDKNYGAYPIINIPFEGAVAYCEWLTEQYNNTSGRKYKKVKFRLPSVNEWQIAALGYKKFNSWILDQNSVEVKVPKNDKDELCKNCEVRLVNVKDEDIRYPWYGAYNFRNKPLNVKGCALGNFKWPESQKPCLPYLPTPDGWIAMSPVKSYFPNGMGLYDVVGNVAEMTNEKGKACGGSWNHFPEQSTIRSVNDYAGPDAAIGFRPFMEIIEQ
jgi:formylglycine-generating enzyme required for sulfatase activity